VLDGFHAALFVSLAVALVGLVAMLQRRPVVVAAGAEEVAFEEAA
jgi:hypothetical protein